MAGQLGIDPIFLVVLGSSLSENCHRFFYPFTLLSRLPALRLALGLRDQQLLFFQGVRRLLTLEDVAFCSKCP